MAVELIGPVDAGTEGGCNGCGFPPIQNLDIGNRKPGKVFQLRVGDRDHTQTVRLCKGCLWELRQQMKGVVR